MAPLSQLGDAAARIARLRNELGASAARATGDAIPRPKPVADVLPAAPAKDAFVVPPRAMLTQPQVNALMRKAREGQPLTLEEMYFLSDPSALPDAALKELDNLDTSSIPLGDTQVVPTKDNLTPNYSRVKESDIDRLYNEINNLADPNEAANQTQVGRTVARLERVLANPEAKAALYARFGSPEFAESRIGSLRQLASDGDIADAARIDRAAQSRDAAGTSRATGALPLAEQNAAVSRVVGGAGMPTVYDGLDVAGLADAFNKLPDDVRLELGEKLIAADPMLGSLISREGGAVSISPNAVAAFRAPRSEYHGLLMELDNAKRIGDPELEAAIKTEITKDIERLTADDVRARRDGNQLFQNQRSALDTLRREMVASLPEVAADFSAARQAAITPPAPIMRAPGARSVEVSGPPLLDAELPSSFDDALARMREQLFDTRTRPSNPVTEDDAKDLAAKAKIPQSKLPVALQDRPEKRSLASRGGVSQAEERAITELRAAEAAFGAASTQAEKLAAAQRLKDAQVKFNKRFSGSKSKTTSGAVKGTEDAAEGGGTVTIEGRARSDSSLNKQGQEELARSLFDTVVGWRDRPDRTLARSDVEFSDAERAQNAIDSNRQLSYDVGDTTPQDMMPQGGDVEDLSMLGEGGKRGRLGGRNAKSRQTRALQELFTTESGKGFVLNPLGLFKGTLEEKAAAAADYIMRSKANTRVEGTPSWEMAREDFRTALISHFGPAAGRPLGEGQKVMPSPLSSEGPTIAGTTQDPASVPAEQGTWPEGTLRQTAESGPNPRENVAGTPPPPPARKDFSTPETVSTPEEDALEASAVELNDSAPFPETATSAVGESAPVTAAEPAGRKLSRDEIEAEAEAAFQQELESLRDSGMSTKKAIAAANRRRKAVQQQLMEANGLITPKKDAPQPDAAKGDAADGVPDDSKPIETKASKDDPTKPAPDRPKNTKPDNDTPVVDEPTRPKNEPKEPAGDKSRPAPPPKKFNIPYFRPALGLAAAGGTAALLSNIGAGGTAAADTGPIPVPPTGGPSPGAVMAEEDAINRALERLRGSRSGADRPTYQTVQNWTVWR